MLRNFSLVVFSLMTAVACTGKKEAAAVMDTSAAKWNSARIAGTFQNGQKAELVLNFKSERIYEGMNGVTKTNPLWLNATVEGSNSISVRIMSFKRAMVGSPEQIRNMPWTSVSNDEINLIPDGEQDRAVLARKLVAQAKSPVEMSGTGYGYGIEYRQEIVMVRGNGDYLVDPECVKQGKPADQCHNFNVDMAAGQR